MSLEEKIREDIIVHFNVNEHYLSLSDFLITAKSVQSVVNEFNSQFFDGKLVEDIVVVPPEEGGFLVNFGIIAGIVVGAFAVIDGDSGKAYIKGLTGHEPSYYSEKLGETTRSGAFILKDAVKGFLEMEVNSLRNVGLTPKEFPQAFRAKNDFYKMCIADKRINGVGFVCEDSFPVSRKAFFDRIDFADGNLELEPEYRVHHLRIISSVNTIGSNAKWNFKDMQTRESFRAYLKDERFKLEFFSGGCPLKLKEEDDVIVAKVEYRKIRKDGEIRVFEINIIEVYKFNNIKLY